MNENFKFIGNWIGAILLVATVIFVIGWLMAYSHIHTFNQQAELCRVMITNKLSEAIIQQYCLG